MAPPGSTSSPDPTATATAPIIDRWNPMRSSSARARTCAAVVHWSRSRWVTYRRDEGPQRSVQHQHRLMREEDDAQHHVRGREREVGGHRSEVAAFRDAAAPGEQAVEHGQERRDRSSRRARRPSRDRPARRGWSRRPSRVASADGATNVRRRLSIIFQRAIAGIWFGWPVALCARPRIQWQELPVPARPSVLTCSGFLVS